MKNTDNTVGAFEAKTHLSRILDDVQNGISVTITKRGKPVARLVPCKDGADGLTRESTLKTFEAIRKKVRGKINIRHLIAAGRKY